MLGKMSREEPPTASMVEYEEKFQAEIAERQERDDTLKAEREAAAAEALEALDDERRAKVMDVTMKENREKEQHYLEEVQRQLESDNPWERITTLVDLQQGTSDEVCDVARARSILIQKKNEFKGDAA